MEKSLEVVVTSLRSEIFGSIGEERSEDTALCSVTSADGTIYTRTFTTHKERHYWCIFRSSTLVYVSYAEGEAYDKENIIKSVYHLGKHFSSSLPQRNRVELVVPQKQAEKKEVFKQLTTVPSFARKKTVMHLEKAKNFRKRE
jgi:hypothetical protein